MVAPRVPPAARELIEEVVMREIQGRRATVTVNQAALLREHGLIDFLGRSTDRGKWVAEYERGFPNSYTPYD